MELLRFKGCKVEKLHEENCFAFFKAGLWQSGFFGCSGEWYYFQQELVVSKMIA